MNQELKYSNAGLLDDTAGQGPVDDSSQDVSAIGGPTMHDESNGAAANIGNADNASDEPAEDPDLALTRKINELAKRIRTYYAHAAKDGSIDPSHGQGRVLALLAIKPETTQKELQFLLNMKQQSLSELLAKLEAKGYIERSKAEDDKRVTLVRLTQAGAQAAPNPTEKPQVSGAYDCLTPEDRAQFEAFVDALNASLREKLDELQPLSNECSNDEDEGEQKRHRYGQMGRGGKGAGGKGKGGNARTAKTPGRPDERSAKAVAAKKAHGVGASAQSSAHKGRGGNKGKEQLSRQAQEALAQGIAGVATAAAGSNSLGDFATQVIKEAGKVAAASANSSASTHKKAGGSQGRGGGRGAGRGASGGLGSLGGFGRGGRF